MYYFYILRSLKDGSLYKGITNNINRRVNDHNFGKNTSTKSKKPFILVYCEEVANRIEARKKEQYFKSGIGRESIKELLTS